MKEFNISQQPEKNVVKPLIEGAKFTLEVSRIIGAPLRLVIEGLNYTIHHVKQGLAEQLGENLAGERVQIRS